MEQYKKRTIALIMASVITVAGAFGENNYKNSLMALNISSKSTNSINIDLKTKMLYPNELSLKRRSADTYVLILPETNSSASLPDITSLSSNIESVSINTMPYSNTATGYTKITVKTTNPNVTFTTTNSLFIPSANKIAIEDKTNISGSIGSEETSSKQSFDNNKPNVTHTTKRNPSTQTSEETITKQHDNTVEEENSINKQSNLNDQTDNAETSNEINTIEEQKSQKNKNFAKMSQGDKLVGILWGILIIFIGIFFYIKAKQRVRDIVGEDFNLSVDNDEPKTKTKEKTKVQKLVNTIQVADAKYTNNVQNIINTERNFQVEKSPSTEVNLNEGTEVVDLDELFQEYKNQASKSSEEDENNALDDFLSGFSFYEEEELNPEVAAENSFDEAAYEKIINNNSITFNKNDIECLGKLISMEIDDDIINNKEKYLVSNPIKSEIKNHQLEDIISSYAISQNIIVTQEDISIINKLMNVELEKDFITDLRTNPDRTKKIEQEILAFNNDVVKKSEIITLCVKDVLPNLSEELKRQSNHRIESNYRPQSVDYSKEYEATILHVEGLQFDVSTEDKAQQRQEEDIEYSDKNYKLDNKELKISGELPDLQDVLAHPEKYELPAPEPVIPDEEALLRNIENVQFKPFYPEDEKYYDDTSLAPSVNDIQEEFKQFNDFEISSEEQTEDLTLVSEYNDFNDIYNDDYVDLDKTPTNENKAVLSGEISENKEKSCDTKPNSFNDNASEDNINSKSKDKPKVLPKNTAIPNTQKNTVSQVEKINKSLKSDEHKSLKSNRKATSEVKKTETIEAQTATEDIKCVLDGEVFNVVNTVKIHENIGCHLAYNNSGYTVLGYIEDKTFNLKHFEQLQSTKIHARKSEADKDGSERYIIKLGMTKFVISINNDRINYVMDL